jgi:NAD(P)-dependent dehydrogenase (short-subunit alcohol dehydrogenase family)
MDLELKNKVALVIGSTGGIGEAVSLSLAENGVRIVLHYYKDEERARKLKDDIEKVGVVPFIIQGDTTKKRDCKKIIKECIKRF